MAAAAVVTLAGCAVEATDAEPSGGDAAPTAEAKPAPKGKQKIIKLKEPIPYGKGIEKTSTLDKGETVMDQEGKPGVQVTLVRVTMKNGAEVGREVVKKFVKRQPVTEVKLVGTHVEPKPKPKPAASNCDSNYAGGCVPIASDVDCADGSGDGPEYVDGPVTVVGDDVYDLNRDSDNIACD